MRALVVPVVALFALTAGQAAYGQNLKSKTPSADGTRYFTFETGLMDDIAVDGILTETRQGGSVASAKLDVCYPSAVTTGAKDRFVVTLNPERGRLVGSGKSQVDGEQVTINILRRQTGTTYSFEGTIKVGSDQMKVASTDMEEQNEKDFREGQPEPVKIVAAPADFTEVSPDTVAFRVKRDALPELVKRLKGQSALLDSSGLDQDCTVLRSGEHVVLVQVNPERAATLLEKVKGLPGLVAAGYGVGTYAMNSAVRIPAADFRKDGKIDSDKLLAAIGASAEKAFSAKLKSTTRDATTGEFALELTRPDESLKGVDLTEVVRLKGFVGPEKLGKSDNLIIWIGDASTETTEVGAATPLKFTPEIPEEDAEENESDSLVTKLAEDLKGKTWNAEGAAWK